MTSNSFMSSYNVNNLDTDKMKQAYITNKKKKRSKTINKTEACTHPGCTKTYGSTQALRLHYRLKHANKNNQMMRLKPAASILKSPVILDNNRNILFSQNQGYNN
eukprot:Pgem_evm1s4694